jgi:hypothetical protein
MSVFRDENIGYVGDTAKSLQPCKRDYEGEIARTKSAQDVSAQLAEAIEKYIKVVGRGEKAFTLTSLYGALLLEQKDLSRTVEYLQEQWEQDK